MKRGVVMGCRGWGFVMRGGLGSGGREIERGGVERGGEGEGGGGGGGGGGKEREYEEGG